LGLAADVATPVPSHGAWQRGYKQARLISKVLGRKLGSHRKVIATDEGAGEAEQAGPWF